MTDDPLPADVRALLAVGRDRTGPDARTVARLRARIETAVIAGASTVAVSATAKSTASVSAIKSIAVKLVVVVVSTSATAYVAHEVTARSTSNVEVASPTLVMPRTTDDVSEIQPSVAIAAPEQVPAATPLVEVAAPVEGQAETAAPSQPAGETPHATLAREIELVDGATLALHGGELAAALDALRTYEAETAGAGQLAQDAAALRVEVLCRTHDASEQKELDAFVARWPRSPQLSHLKNICTEKSK